MYPILQKRSILDQALFMHTGDRGFALIVAGEIGVSAAKCLSDD
jgi:hypothetical protein